MGPDTRQGPRASSEARPETIGEALLSATLGGRIRSAAFGGVLRATWLFPLDVAFRVLGLRFAWLRALFTYAPPTMLEFLGRLRAERAAFRAIRRVPAYRRLPWTAPVPLPFLRIFGRRDATISIMGANIYPEDVETAVYDRPEVAAQVRSFKLAVVQDEAANPRPGVLLELAEGVTVDDAWRDEQAAHVRDVLASLSRDYRTSCDEFPAAMLPLVRTFAEGSGPFAGDADRIKQRRIAPR